MNIMTPPKGQHHMMMMMIGVLAFTAVLRGSASPIRVFNLYVFANFWTDVSFEHI
jgi:hypothetical protein